MGAAIGWGTVELGWILQRSGQGTARSGRRIEGLGIAGALIEGGSASIVFGPLVFEEIIDA